MGEAAQSQQTLDLASYVANLAAEVREEVFASSWTAQALFRALSPLAKQYILRLVYIDGGVSSGAEPPPLVSGEFFTTQIRSQLINHLVCVLCRSHAAVAATISGGSACQNHAAIAAAVGVADRPAGVSAARVLLPSGLLHCFTADSPPSGCCRNVQLHADFKRCLIAALSGRQVEGARHGSRGCLLALIWCWQQLSCAEATRAAGPLPQQPMVGCLCAVCLQGSGRD